MGELIDLGVAGNVVEKSGAWYSYDGQRIGQGRENAKTFLRENPKMAEKLEKQIRANAGLIAEDMLTGPDNDDAAPDLAVVEAEADDNKKA